MRSLSKSKLIAFRQCPKRLWLELNGVGLRVLSAQTEANFKVGNLVGERAQTIYNPKGNGKIFDTKNEVARLEAVARTPELLRSSRPIFEAGFDAEGARAFVDVLLPLRRNGQRVWHMVEVKASSAHKEIYEEDAAIQAFAARSAGLVLHSVAVAHIDSQWVYPGGGDYQGLLCEVDVTEAALSKEGEVKSWIAAAQKIAAKRKEPQREVGAHCQQPYPCGFLDYCQQNTVAPKFPASVLRGPKNARLKKLIDEDGINDLRKIPDDYLNEKHLRVKHHTLAKSVYFNAEGASAALSGHKLPALFLDFETIASAVPKWKGTRPFQALPFQFSLHRMARTGKLTHSGFLDLTGTDPAKPFADALVHACGTKGPIFVYSSYESQIIKALASRFPKMARALMALNDRLVDLLPIVTEHYYHPDQLGSWSIKAVLPTVAPELRYDALAGVQDGTMAMTAYEEAIDSETSAKRKEEIAQQLTAYCALDTLAMVRVWQHLAGRNDGAV